MLFIENPVPNPELRVLNPEIRGLELRDFPQIHEILYSNLSSAYSLQFPDQDPDRCLEEVAEYERNMAETLSHNGRTYLVAELGGEVVGTLGCIHNSLRMKERLTSSRCVDEQEVSPQ